MGSPDGRPADRGTRRPRAGQSALDAAVLDDLVTCYQALTASGLAANLYRRTATANDARRIARRFRSFEDMILRFATRPDLDIFSNKVRDPQPPGHNGIDADSIVRAALDLAG